MVMTCGVPLVLHCSTGTMGPEMVHDVMITTSEVSPSSIGSQVSTSRPNLAMNVPDGKETGEHWFRAE